MELIIGEIVEAVIDFIVVLALGKLWVWIKRKLQPKPKFQLFVI